MKNLFKFLFFFVLLLLAPTSFSRPLVADVSPRKIDIDHNFKGVEILAYGARNEGGSVVIVVRGPKQNYILSEKGKVAGIWTNVKSIELNNVNNFYYLASQKSLKKMDSKSNFKKLEIGLKSINVNPTDDKKYTPDELHTIRTKVTQLMSEKGIFSEYYEDVDFWEETLFRSFINFPKNISKGVYNIDFYLFKDGILTSFQTLPIIVENVGFEAFMNNFAHQHPWFYGLLCVVIAVFMGFFVSFLSHHRN